MSENLPRRRCFRLSLRVMLLIILAIGVWLGWWANSARNQAAAVAAVTTEPYHAGVTYDDDPDYWAERTPLSRRLARRIKAWVPERIRAKLGRDYFHNALAISLSKGLSPGGDDDRAVFRRLGRVRSLDQLVLDLEVVDADVREIARLPNLRLLFFPASSPRLTDASLHALSSLPRLEELSIPGAPITDAGLAHLKKIRTLRSLELGDAGGFNGVPNQVAIKGPGLSHLAELPDLWRFEFYSSGMTGEAFRHLGTLRQLTDLKLAGDAITDDDLRFLASLTNLESFEIAAPRIDGSGFQHLRGLTKLQRVCILQSPRFSDAAIPFLAQLPALETVMIYGTRVTASGLEGFRAAPRLRQMGLLPAVPGDTKRLKQALPRCGILSGGMSL